jgi:beta-xylosidase
VGVDDLPAARPRGVQPGHLHARRAPALPVRLRLTDGAIVYEAIEAPDEVVVDGTAEVDVTVRNGERETVEVVQLYASFPTSPVVRLTVQLVGFARLPVPAGATRTVRFRLEAARLAATGVDGLLALEPGDVMLSSGP